jgi:hypothetical protein
MCGCPSQNSVQTELIELIQVNADLNLSSRVAFQTSHHAARSVCQNHSCILPVMPSETNLKLTCPSPKWCALNKLREDRRETAFGINLAAILKFVREENGCVNPTTFSLAAAEAH